MWGCSICNMWLWVGFYLTSAVVIAQNTVLSSKENKSPNTICEEVLLKLWTIFANQLHNDGGAVIVPSQEHIIYALTLIKKSILDKDDVENVDLKEKLLLREAELAKFKGVYLFDNRPLQALLDEQLITNGYQNVPVKSSQYNFNNPAYNNHLIGLNPIMKYSTRNRDENVPNMIYNKNSDFNAIDPNKILQAVQLSKETNHLLGSDYTADLDHAKGVADRMNKLYESSNEYKYSMKSQQPLRNLNDNYVAATVGVVDNPGVSSFYSKPAVVQASYVAQSQHTNSINQNSNVNQANTLYNIPTQGMHNNGANQSYTLITNAVQSNENGYNAEVNPEYTNQLNTFVNAKYHPNTDHFDEATKEVLPSDPPIPYNAYAQALTAPTLKYTMHKHPYYENKKVGQTLQYTPHNMAQFSDVIPIKTTVNQQRYVPNNRINYNVYSLLNPYYTKSWNSFQSNAYKQSQNLPYFYNYYNYKYNPVDALRPNNANVNKGFQQQGVNTQNEIYTKQNYFKQNYPNTALGKIIIHDIPHPQTGNVNAINRRLPLYTYITRYFNNNGPFTQQTSNYYNDQMVIDKLANWISGTNSVKLNSNIDTEAEIELTYRVNNAPPSYRPSVFYVKFRMPYDKFAKHLGDLLKMQEKSRSASTNTDLYNDLASQYNPTVIPNDMAGNSEDLKSPEEKFLVRARYIQPDESGNDNSNSVDIINLVRDAEPNNANVENPVNNVESNNQMPLQGV